MIRALHAFAFAAVVCASAPAMAGPLANGQYDCAIPMGMGVMPMGRVDISGSTYRFRPMGNVTQGYAGYSVGGDGTIHWAGKLGDMEKPPSVVISSNVRAYGFSIYYRSSPSGFAETMSCRLMH
jgi:hypothetical protein